MNGTQPREIACAIIIDTCGRFLLQQRDDLPGIVCPGMIGFFGGHREGTETFLQCVVREVHEETSYFDTPPLQRERSAIRVLSLALECNADRLITTGAHVSPPNRGTNAPIGSMWRHHGE